MIWNGECRVDGCEREDLGKGLCRKHGGNDRVRAVVIRMPKELHQAVKTKAATEERTMAAAIRYALRVYVAGHDAADLASGGRWVQDPDGMQRWVPR